MYEQDQAAPEAPPLTFPVTWTNEFRVANWRRSITRDRALSVYATAVGCVLADYMDNARGACWPSLETISAEAGCSQSSVQRAISDLETSGYLKVERGRPNRYFAVDATLVTETNVVPPTNVVTETNVVTLTAEVVEENLSALQAEREEVLPSVGLRESNEPERDDSSADAPVVEPVSPNGSPHREDVGEAENPGDRASDTEEYQPTAEELTAATIAIAIEIEEQAADDYEWSDEVDEESTVTQRDQPGWASKPATALAKTNEPDLTAHRQALEVAWQEEKSAGRLNEPGTASWDRRREEINRKFGVVE